MRKIFFSLFFLIIFSKTVNSQTLIEVPCEIKDCNPEWGPTLTKLYKADGDKKKTSHHVVLWWS